MDRRAETRFSISSKVKVTLLSSLDRQIECRMIDISATGMRFIASEPLPNEEIVAVDFEDHLAVATVRNCQAYGDKYSIGTSRIHSLPKDQLPAGQPQYQQIRALLEEKGWSVEIEAADPATYVIEPAAPAPPEPARGPDDRVMSSGNPPQPTKVDETPAPKAPRPSGRRIAIAASLTLAAALVGYLQHLRHQAPVYSAPAASVASVPAPEAPAPEVTASIPTPPATPPATSPDGMHKVNFKVLEPTWVSATADGEAAFAKTLNPGEMPELTFSKIAYVHLGNYHGIEIALDGQPTEPLTGPGVLRLVEITPAGIRKLPWTNGDPTPSH